MTDNKIRLQKYLSNQGVLSRRVAEELIKNKKITINEQIAILGDKVSQEDVIKINGKVVKQDKVRRVVYALYKPEGVVSTTKDELGRKTVVDLIEDKRKIHPVGRLDINSSGLILVTNDGELTNKLLHPSFCIPKIYEALLDKGLTKTDDQKLLKGIRVNNSLLKFDLIEKVGWNQYLFTLHQGKNHQIKKMIDRVGKTVVSLKRIQIGKLELADLEPGQYRELTVEEIENLF